MYVKSENVSLTLIQPDLQFNVLKVINTGLESWDITQFQCKSTAEYLQYNAWFPKK